jgi:hypothetical protein
MTASFETFAGATVSPDSTFEENNTMMEHHSPQPPPTEDTDRLALTHLQQAWNRLDLCEYAPLFRGNARRKIYVKDMVAVRRGGDAYYSLGAIQQRQAFCHTFLTLRSRRVQELFLQCATTCLQANRFMTHADLVVIVQEGNGKRHVQQQHQQYHHQQEHQQYGTAAMGQDDVMQRASKRQRTTTTCFNAGIQCFS